MPTVPMPSNQSSCMSAAVSINFAVQPCRRTYNFPQSRLTDHRIGLTLYKLDSVMDGNLDLSAEITSAASSTEIVVCVT